MVEVVGKSWHGVLLVQGRRLERSREAVLVRVGVNGREP